MHDLRFHDRLLLSRSMRKLTMFPRRTLPGTLGRAPEFGHSGHGLFVPKAGSRRPIGED